MIANSKRNNAAQRRADHGLRDVVRTPTWVIDEMIDIAHIAENCLVLDPFAGDGRIINRVRQRIKKDYQTVEVEITGDLPHGTCRLPHTDWFSMEPVERKWFNVAIFNPPFSHMQGFRAAQKLLEIWKFDEVVMIVPFHYLHQGLAPRAGFWNQHCTGLTILANDAFAQPGTTVAKTLHTAIIRLERATDHFMTHRQIRWATKPIGDIEL